MSQITVISGGPLIADVKTVFAKGLLAFDDQGVIYAGEAAGYDPPAHARRLDVQGGLIMPGLINAHCHGAMTLFRGLADDLLLEDWLHKHIFKAEARFVGPAMVGLCTRLAAAEMLLGGTTTVCDAYFCMDQAAEAYQAAGMRAVVAQGILDFPTADCPDPARNLDLARQFIQRWQGVSPLITPALFAHSVYTCSPQTLTGVAELARELGVIWMTHLSETVAEVALTRQMHNNTPPRHLEALGLLDGLNVAVHCSALAPGEAELLAQRGVAVASCVESNMKLSSGLAHIPTLRAAGLTVALGTDGAASNNDLSMFGEMRLAALTSKVYCADPSCLPAGQALDCATSQGARALGLGAVCGRLAPGLAADVVILRGDTPRLQPMYNPLSLVVYAAGAADVRHVFVAGRQVVENGRLLTMDLAQIMAGVRQLAVDVGRA